MTANSPPFYDRNLKPIADAFGGWLCILSPEFVPGEDLYCQFEKCGLSRQEFDKFRKHARSEALKTLASTLYWNWRWLYEGKAEVRKRPEKSPFHGTARWQDLPGYWTEENYFVAQRVRNFSITKDDVEELITSDPNSFPLLSFWPD